MAFADDYAFLIQALLAVYQVNFDEALLHWAEDLQRIMDLLFWDTDSNGGYFLARADDPSIFARQQEGSYPPLPPLHIQPGIFRPGRC